MILLLVFISALVSVWLYYQTHKERYRFAKNIPTAKPCYPLIGNGLMFLGSSDEDRFDNLFGSVRRENRLMKLWLGPQMLIGTCHPDLVQKILNDPNCIEKPSFFYKFLHLTEGLLVAKHKLWRSQRKALNPTFNLRILHSFTSIFEGCCQNMIQQLAEKSGTTINIFDYISECTLKMVCGSTFGVDDWREEGQHTFLFHLERAFEIIGRRLLCIHLQIQPLYFFTPMFWQENNSMRVLNNYCSKLIQGRRQKMDTSDLAYNDDEDGFRKPRIFLDQILSVKKDGKLFEHEEIYHNSLTMIAAGNDTSALTIAHGCLWLAMYPEIQDRVFNEIRTLFPTQESEILPDKLKLMVYTEMFLKETLRLTSPAPNIARETLAEVELDGIKVPKGTTIFMSLHALHRRPDLWGPDAEKFNPDNFSAEKCQQRHPSAFLPFSGGPRNCIGARYAMISMKIMLIYLLRNFKLTTDIRSEQLRYKFSPTLKLAFDHLVHLEKR